MTLNVVLAEAEVEQVPQELRDHAAVRASARRRGTRPSRTVLDGSEHHDAMDDLEEGDRRGRPDIVHFALLLALDSALNKARDLEVVVHTRHDARVTVDPATRLMRSYPRFVGLLEQLLQRGAVPPGRDPPLLALEEGWSLSKVVGELPGPTVVLDDQGTGEPLAPGPYVRDLHARTSGEATVVLGAFPQGGFRSDLDQLADEVVRFGTDPLMAWTALTEVLVPWEEAADVWRASR